MKAEKDKKTGKWFIKYHYKNWLGERKKSTKRGFETKKDAEEWLRQFLMTKQSNLNISFEKFVELYYNDMKTRVRETTMRNKRYVIDLKISPYFGKRKISDIQLADVRLWQSELIKEGYAPTYLKCIHNQLNAIFNFAVRYYNLKENPCIKVGSMGKAKAEEMDFWTKQEFMKFIEAVMDKRKSYMAFNTLYWTGMRIGELLALTSNDIDLENHTISITKSYQRLDKKDIITPPKTPKSRRTISIPEFLADDLEEYINSLYGLSKQERIFYFTKHYMEKEIKRGIQQSGVKKIRLHDLRHSHASLLIEMGFTPLAIAERLGHDRVETTMNTYAHLYPNKQKQMAIRLDEEHREDYDE